MNTLGWSEFKNFITSNELGYKIIELDKDYKLVAKDDWFEAICYIQKTDPVNADQLDFETNYKSLGNKKLSGPIHTFGLSEGGTLRARLIGIFNQPVQNSGTTNLDWKIPQSSYGYPAVNKQSYMDGIEYFAEDSKVGDHITLQVIDKDGVYYPAGTVLDEFGTNWGILPNQSTIKLYKAKLIPGLYIRVSYTSTGTTDINFICNLFRHMDTNKTT